MRNVLWVVAVAVAAVILLRPADARADDAAASFFNNWRAETWFYFRNNSESSDASQQRKATLRFYQPFALGEGWRLTMREDIPFINTNQIGDDNPHGRWLTNIGDVLIQASLATSQIAAGLTADIGLRVVFPTGGVKPFGDGSFQIAPHLGFEWTAPLNARWLTVAPLARYFRSVGVPMPHYTDINQLQIHPVVSVELGHHWTVSLWQENPIIYDFITTGWFVPIDVLVKYDVNPALSLALGGAVRLLNSYAQYDSMIYGRLRLTF